MIELCKFMIETNVLTARLGDFYKKFSDVAFFTNENMGICKVTAVGRFIFIALIYISAIL